MEGLEWLYREGVSESLSTTGTVLGQVTYDPRNIGHVLDEETWAQAYEIAQTRSTGQAYALTGSNAFRGLAGDDVNRQVKRTAESWGVGGIIGGTMDPLDPDAYEEFRESSPMLASLRSGTSDFAARWYLDPDIVIGKAAGAYRQAFTIASLTRRLERTSSTR